MPMQLTSSAFATGAEMPVICTCEGNDTSPPLRIDGVPDVARSLVLIVDDPDAPDPAAPQRTWVHWLLYNLPPECRELGEGVTAEQLPAGTDHGVNDWGRTGYGGPCPPIGRHRYFHKLYALDCTLDGLDRPDKKQLEQAMQGHVIATAELIGTYRKQNG